VPAGHTLTGTHKVYSNNKNTYYKNNRYSNDSNTTNNSNNDSKLNFDTILFNSIHKLISEMDDSKNNQ
jgi:hypothetical protein